MKNKNPKAERKLKYEIEELGTIIGVGNANSLSVENYQPPRAKPGMVGDS